MTMFDAYGVPLSVGDPVVVFRNNTPTIAYVRKKTPKGIGVSVHRYKNNPEVARYAVPPERAMAPISHPDRLPAHTIGVGTPLVEFCDRTPVLGWEVVKADDYSIEVAEASLGVVDEHDMSQHPDLPAWILGNPKVTPAAFPSGQTYHLPVDPDEPIKAPSGNALVSCQGGGIHWCRGRI